MTLSTHSTAEAHQPSTQPPKGSGIKGALTRLILSSDPARQMNLKITISAQPAYLANLILIWHCVRSGLMDPSLAWPMSLLIVIPMLMIYAVIRFGWTRRLRDPAITVPQMMNALVFIAIGSLTSSPMHIALLSTVAVTMAYSVFALKGRQVVFVQAFSLALFGLGSLVMHHLQPQYYKPEVEILLIAILATTVVMLTWSGSQIAELRARQRRQREELAQMLTRIEELATHDVLTGLYNRRHMNALLAHHVERTQRYGPPLTLAMLDLDHFKQVNDTHGHGVGDDVLKTFASTAQAALDGTDTLARWGGEEFLLMSTANPPDVLALLERLRQQLADTPASPQVPSLRVSFSAGVAFHRVGDAITHTINRADEALYEAKSAGRAQSRLAPDTQAGEGTIVSPSLAPAPVPAPAAALAQASPAPRQTPQALDSAKPAATSMALPGFTPPNGPAATATTDQTQPDRLSWLLGTDPTLRRVLIRTLMGYAPYLMALISVAYCVETGLMAVSHARYLALCLILTPTLMFAIVRSGVTQKLKDPALTLIQIMLATTATSALYATTSYAHAGQLMTLVMVLTVGVCNMSMRQSWITCIYAIGLMSGLMYVMSGQQPLVYEPRVEMGNWILMMFNLPVLMFMGWNLDKLRSRLKKQRAQLKEGVARLSELATRDELTGLNNRGHMNEMLAHYTRRYEQCRESFTVALIDLDHFKRINDQHGHSVGDEVLQAFAHQATETLRQIDVVARWGGEEFLVLCPQSSTDQAMVGLERLRRVFTEIKGSDSVPDLRASFSAGLSTPRDGESIEATLARADNALYEAKRSGRNRICVSQPTPESKTAASVD